MHYDLIIIGGGPAGSTLASLTKKYAPNRSVLILEREQFPRDHVGESQLPGTSAVLHEMGVWEQVEAAGFPIKVGASYTWGVDDTSWEFDFLPVEQLDGSTRPARYEGPRQATAFQVDRARYDHILLQHAVSLGTEVRQQAKVTSVLTEGDRVTGLTVGGETLTADTYADATGAVGLFRKAFSVGAWAPEELKNFAVFDYWRNDAWRETVGYGPTRVQVRSFSKGWIWFIPLGEDRTSVGFVCPVGVYKESGKKPAELYAEALASQPEIEALMKGATPEGKLETVKDWSNVSDRLHGENWYLVGESAGFADPILAAGMTLAHRGAQHLATTLLEKWRGNHAPAWLDAEYDRRQRQSIRQHIRFAQFWYASNGVFADLQDHCKAIAAEAGLSLTASEAWSWLAQGGFLDNEDPGDAALGSFDLPLTRILAERFDPESNELTYAIDEFNTFQLVTEGTELQQMAVPWQGAVRSEPCLARGDLRLPLTGPAGIVFETLKTTDQLSGILPGIQQRLRSIGLPPPAVHAGIGRCMNVLEAMVGEGWVDASYTPGQPKLKRSLGKALIFDTPTA